MTQKRPTAYLLLLVLLFTTLFGSIPAVYAAETEETDRAYQSELSGQEMGKESQGREESQGSQESQGREDLATWEQETVERDSAASDSGLEPDSQVKKDSTEEEAGIAEHQADYFFGLEIAGVQSAGYQAGDEITVRSYLTSSAVQVGVKMASTKVVFDSASFELMSQTTGAGVELGAQTSGGSTVLTAVYTNPGSESSAKLELFTFVLKVKENFLPGENVLTQENPAVMEELEASQAVTAGTLTLTLETAGKCTFQLVPREGQTMVLLGSQLTLDLVVQTAEPVQPRLLNQETGFDQNIFEFVTASAVDAHTTVGQKTPGKVHWLYWNSDAPEFSGTTTLGSITLQVKENAPLGDTVLNQLEANLVVLQNGTEVSYDDLTAPYLPLIIDNGQTYALNVVSGDETMGTAEGGGEYGRNAVVQITAAALEGYRFVNWTSSAGGSFENAQAAQTRFTMPAAATTVTAVFAALSDPEVSPATAFYDKYASSGALEFTITPKDYSFIGIDGMEAETDYTIVGENLSLFEETLKKMDTGDVTLTFQFSDNKTVEVTLHIADSTPTPAGVTVSGVVDSSAAAVVTLKQGETTVATTAAVEGAFTFERVEDGDYSLEISAPGALTRGIEITVSGVAYEVSTEAKPIDLIFGDVDGNGVIAAPDIAAIQKAFSAKRGEANYSEAADADGNGVIAAPDIAVVQKNFGKKTSGYEPWVK